MKGRASLFNSLWFQKFKNVSNRWKHPQNKLRHLSPSNKETLCHLSHNSPPQCVTPSSSVCRRCGAILWADWAALLSSTCLLNDSNYFPGLQATHACFISTSTSPICLHGDAWHTPSWNERKYSGAFYFSPFLPMSPHWVLQRRFLYWGGPLFYGTRGGLQGLTDAVRLVSWWPRHR